ncbi:MAG: hypothetical protein RR415_06545 [Ruthenibacterium sp.]
MKKESQSKSKQTCCCVCGLESKIYSKQMCRKCYDLMQRKKMTVQQIKEYTIAEGKYYGKDVKGVLVKKWWGDDISVKTD